MNVTRVITATTVGAALVLGSTVACADQSDETVAVEEYEDCDPEDQAKKEDDCGYWQKGSEVRIGAQPDMTWLWIWYSFVVMGQVSRPHAGWVPPRGVKPPVKIV